MVAGHRFCVTGEAEHMRLEDFANYKPFACGDGETVFVLSIESGTAPEFVDEMTQEDEGQEIICGRTAAGEPVFEYRWWSTTAGWLVCRPDYGEGRLIMTGKHEKMVIDNALMVLYAMSTAGQETVLFHAAAVSYEGKGYLFLGKSGTGKSTHARLWLEHIEDTELVNDDNPVVRGGLVYGSPWSGKTPCYRNVSYPLGGIVSLSQAPYNKIRRLGVIEAYTDLMASISGQRWDSRIADGLHETENRLVMSVPIWHLECLPDEEAARVCQLIVESE